MRKVMRPSKAPKSLSRPNAKGLTEYQRADAFYAALAAAPPPAAVAPPVVAPPVVAGAAAAPTVKPAKPAKPKGFTFAAYKGADVKRSLERMFHEKCAYCESRYGTTAPIDVEHYRPKGRVKGEKKHPGYWWLAMRWDNLLPSCIDCNRRRKQATPLLHKKTGTVEWSEVKRKFSRSLVMMTGKGDVFPIAGTRGMSATSGHSAEQPFLLNPCDDDPDLHLEFYIDQANPIGLVLPKSTVGTAPAAKALPIASTDEWTLVRDEAVANQVSARGAVSIQIYGLNRIGLVRERTAVLRRLEFLEYQIIKIESVIEELSDPACDPACLHGNQNAVASLKTLGDMVLDEMRSMANDSAPYSAMVTAWIKEFVKRATP